MLSGWRLLPTPRSALRSALPETQGPLAEWRKLGEYALRLVPSTEAKGGPSEGRAWWGKAE